MKAEDLKTKSEDELKKILLDERKSLFNLRFQKSGGTLENTSAIRKSRRAIARVKTFLGKKAAEAKSGKAA
ncbi:MAG: 50S ribosomal protein L29 [Alphaproteobacteria bacterium]|nr:50S ribosomal protein L29 [Alphaproteobacteria bacterium]